MTGRSTSGARIFGAGRFAGVAHMPGRAAAAAPAFQFDAANQRRRRLLAMVHIARKQLRLDDDKYRQVLFDHTGYLSAGDCTEAQLAAALDAFKAMGFRSAAAPKGPKPASHKGAGKARAMWISLYHLGAVTDPSERALEAFAQRQLGCDRLQFANQSHLFPLIEALKGMAERHGWDQRLDGVKPAAKVMTLKRRLVEAILAKLQAADLAPADWDVPRAARVFGGIEIPSVLLAGTEQLDLVAQTLGRVLRGDRK
jgi:hypothetical protein